MLIAAIQSIRDFIPFLMILTLLQAASSKFKGGGDNRSISELFLRQSNCTLGTSIETFATIGKVVTSIKIKRKKN